MTLRRAVLAIALAAAAHPTAAADANLRPDQVAGVYRRSFPNALVDGTKYTSEDVLEIVPIGPRAAYVRARLQFYNGHLCAVYGVAQVEGPRLVYRPKQTPYDGGRCELTVERRGAEMRFGDADGKCRSLYCGARGMFDARTLPAASRRSIRYIARLKASREYAEAMAEWKDQPPAGR